MSISLDRVVPWGRSLDEYVAMFSLDETDLRKSILGCADGPAAFNTDLSRRGGTVVSADPLYLFSVAEIGKRIHATSREVLAEVEKNRQDFVWHHIPSVAALGRIRMAAMERFLSDYSSGGSRYVAAALPSLPFADRVFGLALCSHFLFLYSRHLSLRFHCQALVELCRVADEVRVFPLLDLEGRESRHLAEVLDRLHASGCRCAVREVDYEFQRGGNRMLRIRSCHDVGGPVGRTG